MSCIQHSVYYLLVEMVVRFEMSSSSGKRGLLQYMVPWLENVELVDLQPQVVIVQQTSNIMPEDGGGRRASGNPALSGTGWGSMEATKVVLHNLLYITTKVCVCVCVCVCCVCVSQS